MAFCSRVPLARVYMMSKHANRPIPEGEPLPKTGAGGQSRQLFVLDNQQDARVKLAPFFNTGHSWHSIIH